MRVGLGVLRLAPREFWAMTPVEFDAAVRGAFGDALPGEPLARRTLSALMEQFPDE